MEIADVRYEVGPFRVDPVRRRLHHGDVPVALTPKVFELLLAFLEDALFKKETASRKIGRLSAQVHKASAK